MMPPPRHKSSLYKTQNCPGVTALALSYVNSNVESSKYLTWIGISMPRYLNLQVQSSNLSSV